MKTVLLAAGALALTLSAGQALAMHHHSKGGTASIAAPKQPIPYAELNAYLKASPSQRAKKDWWSGESAVASNGAASTSGANASATTSTAAPASTSSSAASSTTTEPGSSQANPAPSSTSGSALPPPTTSDTSSTPK